MKSKLQKLVDDVAEPLNEREAGDIIEEIIAADERKLKALYTTFQSKKFRDDLAKCVETKGGKGMEYVPWSNIMDRFIKHCPTMSYEFHTYQLKLNQGGIQCEATRPYMGDKETGFFVKTSITCYGVTRSMTSAIYGKTFTQVSLKPQANQIHNAQMRCLCKNAGMFGCGIELWTREEVTQLEAEESQPEATGLEEEVMATVKEVFPNSKEVPTDTRPCKKCDAPMTLKSGKFGSFLACPNYPDCKYTEPLE